MVKAIYIYKLNMALGSLFSAFLEGQIDMQSPSLDTYQMCGFEQVTHSFHPSFMCEKRLMSISQA